MNDVVKRALQKTGLPSVLEPPGLDRGDGSCPDGIAVFQFSGGRSLVWDCTCVDTFAGVLPTLAEAHQFEPIAVKTMGVYGESTGVIIRAISHRLVEATGEPREANWFRQT